LIEILRKPIFPHELADPTEAVADYLLGSNVIALPCRIGDTVWAARYYYGKLVAKQGVVSEMGFLESMKLVIVVKFENRYSTRGFWGKDIFASYEECVAEVERRAEKC
jgi:hypothetical protein